MDENEKIRESIKKLSFTAKLEHLWFYYKWFILFGLLVLIFAIVCMTQCAKKKDPDAVIMYAGPQAISSHYYEYIDSAFAEIMSDDHNKDKYKSVDLLEITLATEKADNAVELAIQQMQNQNTNTERFYIERTTGSSVIYLIDKKIYPSMTEYLMPLEEVLGYLPEEAIDQYGIPLKELECYKYTDLRYLPSDAILCIREQRKLSYIKGNDSDEYYASNMNFFNDLVNWKKTQEINGDTK